MTFSIPIELVSTLNTREHWGKRAARTKSHRASTAIAFRVAARTSKPPPLPVVVTLLAVRPRQMDDDNHVASLKACRDSLAAELGVDDRDPRVTWVYQQRKGKVREHYVHVTVEART